MTTGGAWKTHRLHGGRGRPPAADGGAGSALNHPHQQIYYILYEPTYYML
ncbi:hypothetical protein ACFXDH_11885 [Streptomyces sp. NPDC059467]